MPGTGRVYLVGAGPGDPALVTLRGIECLRRAELVIYDYLVNPQILEHAQPSAERLCLGRHGRGRILSQDEVNRRVVAAALQGRTVVRLKSGDPMVFARAAEEIAALDAAGVPFEIVPGITAALASGSYAGIPLTRRDSASAVALITGRQQEESEDFSPADYAALASFPGTLVFYMGVTTARHWADALIAAGKPGETPVAVLRRCSWPDQSEIRCTLSTVATTIEQHHLRPPVIFIVGEAAGQAATVSWFKQRPLAGQRIVVTRPIDQSFSLRDKLIELGAEVRIQPAIEIREPADWSSVDTILPGLHAFDWIIFSSANGVRSLLGRLFHNGYDARDVGTALIAAMGPATAEELKQFGLRADLLPREYRAESLAADLVPLARGKRFLLARASRGREVLADSLRAAGGEVEQVVVYQSLDVEAPDAELAAEMERGEIDWVTVTSSAIARSTVRLFGDALKKCKLASISPLTSETLRELDHTPTVEATTYTTDGLIETIVRSGS